MATENGVRKPSVARKMIETFRKREEYLTERIAQKEAAGLGKTAGFDHDERNAIQWAIPILEAEWHDLVRRDKEIRDGRFR